MSTLRVTNLKGGSAGSAPNLPDGGVVTGVITATSFSGSGANLTGIDATALKDGSGNVKIQANSTGAVVTGILTVSSNVSIAGTLTYEDVTNIDSVGVITARSGIVATGVVTATSFKGDGSQLTGIDAAPNISITAGEAITAEDSLQVSTNGTATKVTGVSAAFGSEIDGSGSGNTVIYAKEACAFGYDESKNKYVMLYQNGAQSDHIYGVVMTPTNSGDMMEVGVPALIMNSDVGSDDRRNKIVMQYNPDKQGLFYMMHRSTNSGRLKLGMLSISGTGTSATLSVDYDVDTGASNTDMAPGGAAYNTTDDTLAITYTYFGEGASYEPHLRMITYPTASSIGSVGTTEADGGYGYQTDLAWNSDQNCYLLVFRDNSDICQGRVVVNNGSNNGFTYPASKVDSGVGDLKDNTGMRIAYDPNSQKFLGVWVKKSDSKLYCLYITCTAAGAISYGDPVLVTNNAMNAWCDYEVVFNTTTKTFIIAYNYGVDTDTNLRTAKISGTTITLGSELTVQSTYTPQFTALGTGGGNAIIGYNNPPSATDDFKGKVFTIPDTTLSSDTFLGFAASTVASGAAVKAKIAGNTSTRVGLSTGSSYYVQADGTIGTTAVDGNSVKAGIAVNSTTLLIK